MKSQFKPDDLNEAGIQLIFLDGKIVNGILTVEHVNSRGEMKVCVAYNSSPMVGVETQSFFLLNQKQMETLAKVGDVFVLKV